MSGVGLVSNHGAELSFVHTTVQRREVASEMSAVVA